MRAILVCKQDVFFMLLKITNYIYVYIYISNNSISKGIITYMYITSICVDFIADMFECLVQ